MAATQTVPHLLQSRKPSETSLTPRHGVVTLFGYGITVHVDRGHLILKDGIGSDRREARFPRVGHGLRRLVVIGSDGMVSLAALRWPADQDAAFVMLDRDGSVLATTGPVRPSDARLRRAQALAYQSGAALRIGRELIRQKLKGQERIARESLHDSTAAQMIAQAQSALTTAGTIETIRLLESQAAYAYWYAWRNISITFPRNDVRRVPEHWRTFGTRKSPLTESPRLAVNPPNAMLNYLYALLESQARLASAALGLDPGLGVMHVDSRTHDSLACDLMEPVRPQVDAYLLDWISREPLQREWFFEKRDGNCRLMGSLAVQLSQTARVWSHALAPLVEWVARMLWATIPKPGSQLGPGTPLTGDRRRQGRGGSPARPTVSPPRPPSICRTCGVLIIPGRSYCPSCGVTATSVALVEKARRGRVAAQSCEAQARRAETQRRHHTARQAWQASSQPAWLDQESYLGKIQPRLANVNVSVMSSALRVSRHYAADIRAGRRLPHPRHWPSLARLVGISPDE